MKKLFTFPYSLFLVFVLGQLSSCKQDDPTPVPDYQIAIDAKYKAIGWDKDGHTLFNGTKPVITTGGTGYVQYYAVGGRKTAIYYYPNYGAFAMDTAEMTSYDNAGQDKYAFVVSDTKPCGTGCKYNDVIMVADKSEGVNIGGSWVYGEIYKKYKELNRWEGVLGTPLMSEGDLTSKKGRYVAFTKGQIYWSTTTGVQAFWGKIATLYGTTGYDTGWLGLPTESMNPNKGDTNLVVAFQGGKIGVEANGCGRYYSRDGLHKTKDNISISGSLICY